MDLKEFKKAVLLLRRNTDKQNEMAESRLRLARELGQWLAGLPKNAGGRPRTGEQRVPDKTYTLDELGITKRESSTWQTLAMIPVKEFEKEIRSFRLEGKELTFAHMLRKFGTGTAGPSTASLHLSLGQDMAVRLKEEAQQRSMTQQELIREILEWALPEWERESQVA